MGYREDGNFNIDWDFEGTNSSSKFASQNSDFLYPDKSIRFMEAQAALDKSSGKQSVISIGDYKLHRGYIRNLEQPAWGDVPITRCNFQFNPQQIQQNVSMREDVYLPLLQAPEQLAQPLGANVNFSFDLFFDRSHELAKGVGGGNFFIGNEADANITGKNDAYDIGVMADLRTFYSVIGQGFSREMIEFQKKMFRYGVDQEQAPTEDGSSTSTTDSTSDTSTPPSPQQPVNDSDIENLINSNIGNFALLMPMPVRLMFSSLFMVDGFITSTSVDFLKFSTKMVPVQCRIGVSMNALYIGFARTTTFLTDTFNKAAVAAAAEQATLAASRDELIAALQKSCSKFIIGASYDGQATVVDWDSAATLKHNKPLPIWVLALDKVASSTTRNLFLGFPNIKPNAGGDETVTIAGTEYVTREGADRDYILALYDAGAVISFTYDWSITVWGRKPPYPTLSYADANRFKNGEDVSNVKILGSYSGTESSSSKDQWGYGTNSPGNDAERIRRRSIRGGAFNNTSSDSYKISTQFGVDIPVSWGESSYFLIEVNVTLSASSSGGTPISVSYASGKRVYKGDQYFGQATFPGARTLNWGNVSFEDIQGVNLGGV